MEVNPGLDVPVYENDFRKEGLQVTTSKLLMQSPHEELVPTGPGERDPADLADNTQASKPVATGGNWLAQLPSASEQRLPTAPAEVIESHPPLPSSSRIWNEFVALPRLFLQRELREELLWSENHVVEKERVRVAKMKREDRAGETAENCIREQGTVDNIIMENQPGARSAHASTPSVENGAVLINREEVMRRALFRVNRGDSTRLLNQTFSELTLSRGFRRG